MSLTTPYAESYLTANGVDITFGFSFEAISENYVRCLVYMPDGTIITPSFTVDIDAGEITIDSITTPDGELLQVPPEGATVRIYREAPESQDATASVLQAFTSKQLEKALDKIVATVQQVDYKATHKTVRTSETERDVWLDKLTDEHDDELLKWDESGHKITTSGLTEQGIRNATTQAITTADEAKAIAKEARTTANEAKSTANKAKTTADGIDGKATNALTNSEQAVATANEAASAVAGKQDVIPDLATIRAGAAKGATAVQPAAIADMETKTHAAATYQPKGDYALSSELPEAKTGTAGQVYTKTATGAAWKDATGGGSGTDNNGLEGDYCSKYGIVDETASGLPTQGTGNQIIIPAQLVLDVPGVSGLTTNASTITHDLVSTTDCEIFLAQGTVIEATEVYWQTTEPEDSQAGYLAWWNGTGWKFKSNDTGNVWRAANAVRIAKCVFTGGSLTRLCFTGCRLLNKQLYATKADLETKADTTTVNTELAKKQDKLVSGTNIKTVNGETLLGAGNVQIESGGAMPVGAIFSTPRTGTIEGAVEANGGEYNIADYSGAGSIGALLQSGDIAYVSKSEFATQVANTGACGAFGWNGMSDALYAWIYSDSGLTYYTKSATPSDGDPVYSADGSEYGGRFVVLSVAGDYSWIMVLDHQCDRDTTKDIAGTPDPTFLVPKLDGVYIVGATENIGDILPEQLPNITGTFNGGSKSTDTDFTGAFQWVEDTGGVAGGSFAVSSHVNFDASKSSSTYTDGGIVRPKSVQYRVMVQIATGATDEALETCTEVLSDVSALKLGVAGLKDGSGFSAGGKKTIVQWGLPDYTAGVSIPDATHSGATYTTWYTATADGVIMGSLKRNAAGTSYLAVGEQELQQFGSSSGGDVFPINITVSKGDVLSCKNNVGTGTMTNCTFFPFKGAQ